MGSRGRGESGGNSVRVLLCRRLDLVDDADQGRGDLDRLHGAAERPGEGSGDRALKALLDVQKLGQGLGGLGGGGGGLGGLLVSAFGGLLGGGFKPNTTLGGFLGVPSYDGGGKTGSGPRAGGLDGKGGFLALLHPNEGVDDYTKQIADPRAAAGGLTSSPGVTVSIQIPIDATGADSAAIARLEAGLAETNRTLPARVVSTVQQAINSRVIR